MGIYVVTREKETPGDMSGYDFRDACEAGDLDKVKGLIKSVDVNETDEYGYTGLHLAAEHGHMKVVEELMAAGAKLDPLVFDSYYLPVHLAINKGHTDIAKKLINAGCKINELIYMGACCGPIHLSIMKENMEIFNLLLEKKCDLNLCDEVNGNTPLMLATSLNMLDWLIGIAKHHFTVLQPTGLETLPSYLWRTKLISRQKMRMEKLLNKLQRISKKRKWQPS